MVIKQRRTQQSSEYPIQPVLVPAKPDLRNPYFFFFLAGVPSTVNHQGPNDSIALDHGGIRGIAARSETPTFRLPEEAEMRSVRLFT
jgi:hypothetical protein